MAVKTIMDGQIPIIGNGVSKVIDFGFTNKVKLEGTKQVGQVCRQSRWTIWKTGWIRC